MRRLLAVTALLCLTPLSSEPAEAQRAGSSARGTVRGTVAAPVSTRTVPSRGEATRMPSDLRFDPFFVPRDPFRTGRDQPRFGTRREPRSTHRDVNPRRRPPHRNVVFDAFHFPVIYYYPAATTHVVHVQSDVYVPGVVVPAAPVASGSVRSVEGCAIVTVLQPDYRGYWKELYLPVAGARNTDELQRVLDARIDEGVAFTIRDSTGQTLEIPARAALDRIVVDPCR